MPVALIVLALVAIIIVPLLGFMSSSLKQGSAIENRTNQTYIADAGVESAAQKILKGNLVVEDGSSIVNVNDSISYTVNDINGTGSSALVTITYTDAGETGYTYHVASIGTDSNGEKTQVEADIMAEIGQYYSFLNNITTSQGNLEIQSSSGHVHLNGTVESAGISGSPTFDSGGYNGSYAGAWPTVAELQSWYASEVPVTPGPVTISSDLTSTIYVHGNVSVDPGHGNSLNLNGYTIFADGNITQPNHTTIFGPGVVAATGTITAYPGDNIAPDSGILFFAGGKGLTPPDPCITVFPSANFNGWISGETGILLKQGSSPTFNWVQPNPYIYTLDFPGLLAAGPSFPTGRVAIQNWDISSQ